MSEYVVDFGDKSTAFVGLAMAEAESHGATLKERVVRCRDCKYFEQDYTDGASFGETVCWAWDNGHDYPNLTVPHGFCFRGERKDA